MPWTWKMKIYRCSLRRKKKLFFGYKFYLNSPSKKQTRNISLWTFRDDMVVHMCAIVIISQSRSEKLIVLKKKIHHRWFGYIFSHLIRCDVYMIFEPQLIGIKLWAGLIFHFLMSKSAASVNVRWSACGSSRIKIPNLNILGGKRGHHIYINITEYSMVCSVLRTILPLVLFNFGPTWIVDVSVRKA